MKKSKNKNKNKKENEQLEGEVKPWVRQQQLQDFITTITLELKYISTQ